MTGAARSGGAAPRTPANVEPYVRALGADLAITFFLTFGGAPVGFSSRPTARSRAAELIGVEGCKALVREIGATSARVPLPKRWIAQYLHSVQGMGIHDIARRVHASSVSVSAWVRGGNPASGKAWDQLSLFE